MAVAAAPTRAPNWSQPAHSLAVRSSRSGRGSTGYTTWTMTGRVIAAAVTRAALHTPARRTSSPARRLNRAAMSTRADRYTGVGQLP